MGLETGTYIDSLVSSNPTSGDAPTQGDDHIRLIKATILASFPSITGAVTSTHTELNILDGVTSTAAEINKLDGYTGNVSDLNILSGGAAAGVTAAEFQYLNGVTSAIQTQLDAKEAADADILKADTADTLTAGYDGSVYDNGTQSSGTLTPDEDNGNFQKAVNGGAHTLAPPATSNGTTIVVQYTNNASAGAITTSGFTKVDGSFTTTDGDDFLCFITKHGTFSHLNIVALQ